MNKILKYVLLGWALLALQGPLQAQTTTTTTNTPAASITGTIQAGLNSINVPSEITQIQNSGLAVNTGFWYDWKAQQVDATYFYPPFGGMNVDSWGTWDYVVFGYGSPNVLVGGTGFAFNLGAIAKKWDIQPSGTIGNVLNSASLELTPMLGLQNIGGKNRLTGGPGLSLKITF